MSVWPDDTPWRQGHVLTKDSARALELKHPDAGNDDDTVVVVVSHDCDLVQATNKELYVEAIIGIEIEKEDGNFTFGKGARVLHLPFSNGNEQILVELDARNKVLIEKERLGAHEPSSVAKPTLDELNILQRWLSSRYMRAAFADSFNDRFRDTVGKGFDKIVKATGLHLLAIYFEVDSGEEHQRVAPEDCHSLSIYLVHNVEPDEAQALEAAEAAKIEIEKLFKNQCMKGGRPIFIELRECHVESEATMSLYVVRRLKRWHTDHLSLRTDPQGKMPSE